MTTSDINIAIIGGGLAGTEAAMQLATCGFKSTIFEMKPQQFSAAHEDENLAELVCSNSFRSTDEHSAVGLLKQEMFSLNSLILQTALETQVPAGKALAVDRRLFSQSITQKIKACPLISVVRAEVESLNPQNPLLQGFSHLVVAAGPMASESLSKSLAELTGNAELYFYDAIAPIIFADSINMDIAFTGSRYTEGEGDYLNCPFNKEEYTRFYEALSTAKLAPTHNFEDEKHFEACMPIEALASRGFKTLCFGPFKPVGFIDPRTGERPFALVQLRTENLNRSTFNLVGCQSKLLHHEQERIFRMIPGLEQAEFARFSSMHRNTFINAPQLLNKDLSLKNSPNIYLAGQITGVEGYVESAASGLWLGLSLGQRLKGINLANPPLESALGALLNHLTVPAKRFQPSNVQFGLMPELNKKASKATRKILYAERAQSSFANWLDAAQLATA